MVRIALSLLLSVLTLIASSPSLRAQTDESPNEIKKANIAGEWVSDSPLESFVRDDSPQPVNKFRIEETGDGGFQARYIGKDAVGVKLKWVEDKHHFKGLMDEGGRDVTLIVVPTSNPDVLKCKIISDFQLSSGKYLHEDKWRRAGSNAALHASEKPASELSAADKQSPVLVYDDGAELTAEIKSRTEKLLIPYQRYLASLGFKLERGQVTLRLQSGMSNAHYYHTNRSIVMDPLVVSDETVMRREYNHHALSVALGDDAQEIFESCSGIESALADYFGCSQCDDPDVGIVFVKALYGNRLNQSYLRTLDNTRSFTEIEDRSGRHAVGEVVGGALWEMRSTIGPEVLDPLLYKAWVGLVKSDANNGQILRFTVSLLETAQKSNPDDAQKIRKIFQRRGLNLP